MFKPKLALRPNCLLTRRPIVILQTAKAGLFSSNPYQYAHYFLTEHGYQVSLKPLSEISYIKKSHVFLDIPKDSSTLSSDELQKLIDSESTLSLVDTKLAPQQTQELEKLLDLCVQLAELDFTDF